MNKFIIACSLFVSFFVLTSAQNSIPKLDIFIAIGQSNMAGRGYLTEEYMGPVDSVYLLTSTGDIEVASNPMNKYSSIRKDMSVQRMSPSYSFAKKIRDEAGVAVGIMQNARGATTINQWAKGSAEGYYEEAVRRALQMKRFGEIKGIIWHQGEGDSGAGVTEYPTKLRALVDNLRADLNLPDLYFIAGELASWRSGGTGSTAFNNMIQTISSFVPNSDYISSVGTTPLIDVSDPHFDQESNIILGERYAIKMLKHVYNIQLEDDLPIEENKYSTQDINRLVLDMNAGKFDVYELITSGGEYVFVSSGASPILPVKSFTLRAAKGLDQKPIISLSRTSKSTTTYMFYPKTTITATFEGLAINGLNTGNAETQPNFFRNTGQNASFIIRDCYFYNFTNSSGVFRIDAAGTAMDIQRSTFKNCSRNIINCLTASLAYGDILLKNNTFSDMTGATALISYAESSSGTNVVINHCTMNNFNTTRDIFAFKTITGGIDIKNSLFKDISGGFDFSNPMPTMDACYLDGFAIAPTGNITNSFTGSVPIFKDEDALHYGLTNKSEFICADGLPVGNTMYDVDWTKTEDLRLQDLIIYNGKTIQLREPGTVKLFSVQGQMLTTLKGMNEYDINFPPGLYLLKINTNTSKSAVRKIIVP